MKVRVAAWRAGFSMWLITPWGNIHRVESLWIAIESHGISTNFCEFPWKLPIEAFETSSVQALKERVDGEAEARSGVEGRAQWLWWVDQKRWLNGDGVWWDFMVISWWLNCDYMGCNGVQWDFMVMYWWLNGDFMGIFQMREGSLKVGGSPSHPGQTLSCRSWSDSLGYWG